ncbi:MAG: hypothetical protein QXZ70_09495 [Candidatus Bathyarchaeia archaeon]
MSNKKELKISTVVVSGNPNLFKAALSALLGVTYKKFSRRVENSSPNEFITKL